MNKKSMRRILKNLFLSCKTSIQDISRKMCKLFEIS